MIGRRILAAIVLLLACATAHADYQASFAKGITAIDRGNWNEAVLALNAAIQENPKEGGRVLIYGMRYKAYLPSYYLGVAYLNLGNCDAARKAWVESERQGAIFGTAEQRELQQLRLRCPGSLAAPAEAVAIQSVVSSPTALPERPAEVVAQVAPRPTPPISAPPSPARAVPAPVATAATSVAVRQVATPVPQPSKVVPPPDSLLAAAAAYFQGNYAAAARQLATAEYPDRRATAQARLFRAAANYDLFLLGGGKDPALEQQATSDIRECSRLDPSLKVSAKAFSPRFADFFQRSRG